MKIKNAILRVPKLTPEDKEWFKKQLQIFNFLLEKPVFKKEVNRLREKYGIPRGGFRDWKDYFEWSKPISKKGVVKTVNREKIRLDISGKPIVTNKDKCETRFNPYAFDIDKLLANHDLSVDWHPVIDGYVSRGQKLTKLPIYDAELFRETCDGVIIKEDLFFLVSPTLGIKDLSKKRNGITRWADQIEPLQQLMQGSGEKKKRTVRRAKEQKIAYKMKKQGDNADAIYDRLNQLPEDETVDLNKGEISKKYSRVLRSRYKKRNNND